MSEHELIRVLNEARSHLRTCTIAEQEAKTVVSACEAEFHRAVLSENRRRQANAQIEYHNALAVHSARMTDRLRAEVVVEAALQKIESRSAADRAEIQTTPLDADLVEAEAEPAQLPDRIVTANVNRNGSRQLMRPRKSRERTAPS